MRIIAGRFKGTGLPSSHSRHVRPTTDRVREAVFSILGSAVEGAAVLDLFAGTGAMGFEALSRGARFSVFVDSDQRAVRSLREAARILGVGDQIMILGLSAAQALRKLRNGGEVFDVVFLDPPYGLGIVPRIMSDPVFGDLVEPEGLVVVETEVRAPSREAPAFFEKTFSGDYGETLIEIYVREPVTDDPARQSRE